MTHRCVVLWLTACGQIQATLPRPQKGGVGSQFRQAPSWAFASLAALADWLLVRPNFFAVFATLGGNRNGSVWSIVKKSEMEMNVNFQLTFLLILSSTNSFNSNQNFSPFPPPRGADYGNFQFIALFFRHTDRLNRGGLARQRKNGVERDSSRWRFEFLRQ